MKVRGRHNLGSSVPTATRRWPKYYSRSQKRRSAAKTGKGSGRPGFQPGSVCRSSAPRLQAKALVPDAEVLISGAQGAEIDGEALWGTICADVPTHRWSSKTCFTAETMQGTGIPGSQWRSLSPSLARCSAASIQAKIQVTTTLNRCRAIQAKIHADDSLWRCRGILLRIEHQAAWAAERRKYQLRTEQKHG